MEIAQKIGPFRVISHIAKGGMGDVYLAKHEEKDRLVAVKILPVEYLKDRKRSQYLEREVKIARKLRHPNVVDIYGLHRENGIGYLIMEYLDGGSLRKHIKARDLGPAEILEVTLKICDGLHYIHNHKFEGERFHSIIHRDIKPENILLSKNGRIKVADFGLSLSEGGWTLRKTKSRAGTPLYMSPEQIRGKPLDIRTDIYSLGLVLYELLTGQLPYKAQKQEMYMKMTVSKKVKPAPPSYIDKKIPEEFDSITLKALKKKPEERYQTVAEMMLDLRRLAPGLAPDDLTEEFQFMRDVRVAKSTHAGAEDSPAESREETYGADDTAPAEQEIEPENDCASEPPVEDLISDNVQSEESGASQDDAAGLRQEILQLHREMIYAKDPEKARTVRTAKPGESPEKTEEPSPEPAAEDQIEEPFEEISQEPVGEAAEPEQDKSDETPEPEAPEASAEAEELELDKPQVEEPELEEPHVEEPKAEEPEAEFLPDAESEDDSKSPEPEGSSLAPAALGENSGIVDAELVVAPDAALEDADDAGEGAAAPVEEEVKPAPRQAAGSSNGNGAAGNVEPTSVHAGDESAHESFGALDMDEIEEFIFIGRKKG